MKTRELIRLLQEEDPEGELECCVGNVDIHFVSREPAYYDGCLQVLLRDEANPYYNIIGGRFCSEGEKLVINSLSIRNAIGCDTNMPVEYDSEYTRRHYEGQVAEWREGIKKIERDVEFDSFSQHVWGRLRTEAWFDASRVFLKDGSQYDAIRATIREWFDTNWDRETPLPADLVPLQGMSYNDARNEQWYRLLMITMEEGRVKLEWRESVEVLV